MTYQDMNSGATAEVETMLASEVNMDSLLDDSDADSTSATLVSLLPAGLYLVQIAEVKPRVAQTSDGVIIPFNGKPRLGSHQVEVSVLFDIERAKRVHKKLTGNTYEVSGTRRALMDNWEKNRGSILSSLAVVARCQTGLDADGVELTPAAIRDLKGQALAAIKQNAEGFKMKEIYADAVNCLAVVRIKEDAPREYNGKTYDAQNSFSPDYMDPPSSALYNMAVQWASE